MFLSAMRRYFRSAMRSLGALAFAGVLGMAGSTRAQGLDTDGDLPGLDELVKLVKSPVVCHPEAPRLDVQRPEVRRTQATPSHLRQPVQDRPVWPRELPADHPLAKPRKYVPETEYPPVENPRPELPEPAPSLPGELPEPTPGSGELPEPPGELPEPCLPEPAELPEPALTPPGERPEPSPMPSGELPEPPGELPDPMPGPGELPEPPGEIPETPSETPEPPPAW